MVSAPYAGPRPSPRRPKARSAPATRSSAACCDLSPVSQAAPDLQEQLGCVRSCPFGQTRILTPIWESSDASGTLATDRLEYPSWLRPSAGLLLSPYPRRSVATNVKCLERFGAMLRHSTCVCGNPCSKSNGGPLPPLTPFMVASDVSIRIASNPGKNRRVDALPGKPCADAAVAQAKVDRAARDVLKTSRRSTLQRSQVCSSLLIFHSP